MRGFAPEAKADSNVTTCSLTVWGPEEAIGRMITQLEGDSGVRQIIVDGGIVQAARAQAVPR
jgi:hypothetical protein